MSRQNGTRVLVEKIEDAIEQAEALGLAFVAGILMMARLEAMQTDLMTTPDAQTKGVGDGRGRSK